MGIFTRTYNNSDVEKPASGDSSQDSASLSDGEYNRLQNKMEVREGSWLLKFFTGKTPRPIVPNKELYPFLTANIFSIMTFEWVTDSINRGYLRRLEEEDMYQLGGDLAVRDMTARFEMNLNRRIEQYERKNPGKAWSQKTILLAINDTFKRRFWYVGGTSKVLADLSQILCPLVVRALVKYVQQRDTTDTPVRTAIGLAIAIAILQMLAALNIASFFHISMVTGAQVKATLMNVIYSKSFKVSTKGRFEWPNGKVNSLVMSDMNRIDLAVGTFHFIWAFPISFSVAIIVLCIYLGWSAIIGILMVLAFVCSVYFFNRKLKEYRIAANVHIDARVRAINEIINTLKMIKFYSWEKPYYKIVEACRGKEKKFILKIQLLKAMLNTGISTITYFAAMVTFLLMYSNSDNFSSYNVFSAITLFNMLRMPMNLLPLATGFAVDAYIALGRVAEFLQVEEGENTVEKFPLLSSNNAIEIEHGTFQWDVEEDEGTKTMKAALLNTNTLKALTSNNEGDIASEDLSFPGLVDINLTIARGELVVVTGSIGTGKTSLLNAIEGSMKREDGESRIFGSLTFCSYPWVQNASIRDNITFGMPYDQQKYQTIIKACALDVDFEVLPAGDMTEVGERGITLSGGQKARINLARAVYADRDIILLDDVLSAVDARVGKHIMNECICGLLAGKTRLLATHQLSLIGAADRVIILDGSGSIDVGTTEELLARSTEFKNLMEYSKETQPTEEEVTDMANEELEILSRQATKVSKVQTNITGKEVDDDSDDESNVAATSGAESRASGGISPMLYFKYFVLGARHLGWFIVPVLFLVVAVNGFLQIFYSIWLTFWLSERFALSKAAYESIFVALIFAAFFSYLILYVMMASLNNSSSLRLFNLGSSRLLKTPMWFMDITPLGRILNRFTKDVDTLDTDLMEQLRLFITSVSMIFATVIVCACYIPWFLIAIPVAGTCYYYIFTYYKQSALDIKRIEAANRSIVFSLFNESLSGMKVIKSYSSTSRFKQKYEVLIDKMNSAYYLTFANQRWLSLRLDIVSTLLALFVSILCSCGVFDVSGSAAGLLISYMVQVCSLMSIVLRAMTQVENDFNSVERLFEYAFDLPQEGPFEVEDAKPDASWPQTGALGFEDVSLSYREGLPLVLKNVTFNVRGSEKIGVCGRTGAGKSTIMNALFRVSPLSSGKITIDDVDIGAIGLEDLRSKLSIIPQDPVLFHGTIRQNLDPFESSTDQELWDALRRSWLVEDGASGVGAYTAGESNIKSLHKFHLDQLVEDDGANFSLGERQLLALARALVRNSKILILDEATSSVDYETDAKIQSTITNEFRECTILCIAHRLKTILHYDRILVLDKGEVREFDTPMNLFKMGGIFSEMCARSDITAEDFA